jgi:hypothetical protein
LESALGAPEGASVSRGASAGCSEAFAAERVFLVFVVVRGVLAFTLSYAVAAVSGVISEASSRLPLRGDGPSFVTKSTNSVTTRANRGPSADETHLSVSRSGSIPENSKSFRVNSILFAVM